MEPAKRIIALLGGPSAVAEEVGIHRTRVSMWQAPREKGGTNGLIPYRHIPAILEMARKNGVEIDPAEFIPSSQDAARLPSAPPPDAPRPLTYARAWFMR